MLRPALLLLPLFAVSLAHFRYAFPLHYDDLLISPLVTSFSCDNRPYGYYADVDNACQVYHVCMPLFDADGDLHGSYHFSFVCGNATVFCQQTLTCIVPNEFCRCEDSPEHYDFVNARFAKVH
ncbi:U-scoloptoxin(01)-Cw1a-like [Eriocheir sinensis]|uniref:U-scoloptoxin(01)-Cw1a-like n=1 Tax=Eriocheir sinensis TaxID=95602 RepID=UPI0021C7CD19|nr:U-scoloptoxin(01)-Cw1a-like [Eriocheir sinensis]